MTKTVIHDKDGSAMWGNEDHLETAQSRSFASLIFELLSEKIPDKAELEIFELILNISIDHGPDTPSAQAVQSAKVEGKSISESIAAGILQINDVHGGAIEPLMEILYRVEGGVRVQEAVEEYLKGGKKLPGYGHRIYKDLDPRAQVILDKLGENQMGVGFVDAARALESELENQVGKKLPLNVDGAIAAALCSFGWEPRLGKAVFIVARTPGLCGQFLK